jgi:hypothetical protein
MAAIKLRRYRKIGPIEIKSGIVWDCKLRIACRRAAFGRNRPVALGRFRPEADIQILIYRPAAFDFSSRRSSIWPSSEGWHESDLRTGSS